MNIDRREAPKSVFYNEMKGGVVAQSSSVLVSLAQSVEELYLESSLSKKQSLIGLGTEAHLAQSRINQAVSCPFCRLIVAAFKGNPEFKAKSCELYVSCGSPTQIATPHVKDKRIGTIHGDSQRRRRKSRMNLAS